MDPGILGGGGMEEGPMRRGNRPLDQTTNGHPPGSEHLSRRDYRSSDSEMESDSENDRNDDRAQNIDVLAGDGVAPDSVAPYVSSQERSRFRLSPEQVLGNYESQVEWQLFLFLAILRACNALMTSRTTFAPDEHWQSLEIAHRIVFGYGWTTWEWIDIRSSGMIWNVNWGDGPIRSALYPAVFVPIYGFMKLLRLDDTMAFTLAPGLLQSLFATFSDLYTFKLARKVLNERAAWVTMLPTLFSMYTLHSSTRTLSNSLEATLSVSALYYFPLSLPEGSGTDLIGEVPLVDGSSLHLSLFLFAMSAALRPSNVILSAPLVFQLIKRITANINSAGTALEAAFALLVIGRACFAIGSGVAIFLAIIDSLFYHRLTFTPFSFLKRNVIQGLSLFYGSSPIHFYLTSGLPFVCFLTLPYTLHGLYESLRKPKVEGLDGKTRRWYGIRGERDPDALHTLAVLCLVFVGVMSLLGHKEQRFLQPLVPIFHLFEGYSLAMLPPIATPFDSIMARSIPVWTTREHELSIYGLARFERRKRVSLLESLAQNTSPKRREMILSPVSLLPHRAFQAILIRMRDAAQNVKQNRSWAWPWLLVAHLVPTLYLFVHGSGTVRVMEHVGRLARTGQVASLGVLMPCHSTPWQSHLHASTLQGENAWFITCEPPLAGQPIETYRDESDCFYDDPYDFLQRYLTNSRSTPEQSTTLNKVPDDEEGIRIRPWPSHIIIFESLLHVNNRADTTEAIETVGDLLMEEVGYKPFKSFWNSFWHPDARRAGRVILLGKVMTFKK